MAISPKLSMKPSMCEIIGGNSHYQQRNNYQEHKKDYDGCASYPPNCIFVNGKAPEHSAYLPTAYRKELISAF
jgi:hypothetical protein